MTSVVVVGASVAGVRTAQALRREGHDGEVIIVGSERDFPYDKPPLSKALLAGTTTEQGVRLITPESATELGIELKLGVPAAHVDIAARSVVLEDGDVL